MNTISKFAKIGKNVEIGSFNIIGDDVVIEEDVKIENFCILKGKIRIGRGTVVKNYVELRDETTIGEDCVIDSRVSSSGNCIIGNRVVLRYDTIIARGVEIGDDTYVCPRVMTNNLNTTNEQIGGAKIGKNCFIGTNAVIQHGVHIGDDVVIGSLSFVNKDCVAKGLYLGIPAVKKEKNKKYKCTFFMVLIAEIAKTFQLKIIGNSKAIVNKAVSIEDQVFTSITWVKNQKFSNQVRTGTVLIYENDLVEKNDNVNYLITSENPKLIFSKILQKYFTPPIDYYLINDVEKHKNNSKLKIGDFVFIGQNVIIGDYTVILPNSVIEADTIIGENCLIKSHVSIGSEGMGLELNPESDLLEKFPQIGNVILEDYVEVGPCSTIRRGALKSTRIGKGSKIGSLTNIGHNCDIGENCILTSGIIFSGSSKIGGNAFVGVNSSIRNGIQIGNNATIGMGTVVIKDVPNGATVIGNPGKINTIL